MSDENQNRRSGSGQRSSRKKAPRSRGPRRNDRNDSPPPNEPPVDEIVDIADAEADELHKLAIPDDGDREPMREEDRDPRPPQRNASEPRRDRGDRDRDQRDRDPRPQQSNQPQRPPPPKDTEGYEYSMEVGYDRQAKQFVATVLEFPDLKITDVNRETAVRELEVKIDDKLLELRESNQPVPEPLGTKRYPESLSVRVSQGLYRKLDVLSRHERHELAEMVNELLTGAVERRFEQINGRGAPPHQQQGGRQQHHRDRDRDHQHGGHGNHGNQKHHNQKQHRNQGGRGGRMSQSNYQNTMSSRENFMEYVRNLEKGGGAPPGGWKKR